MHKLSWSFSQISKKRQTATFIYHAIAIYVPATNMTTKCHIYVTCAGYLICINGESMPMYMLYMNFLPLIMWQEMPYRRLQ